MTGPDHYKQAEQHLKWANERDIGVDAERYHLMAAQVHATLAATAASIDLAKRGAGMGGPDWTEALA